MNCNKKTDKCPMRPTQAAFPATRLRRQRQSPSIRALTRENTVTVDDFIWPVFVRAGEGIEEPIPSMPGVFRRSVDKIVEAAREAADLGIPAMCIFPYTGIEERTEDCAGAWDPDNHANRAIRAIKKAVPQMAVMTVVALDTYTINGHDGFVENGEIVGRTDGKLAKNEFLCTPKTYGDFVLTAKVKLGNGNSGIQFRSARAEDGVVSGPQADVADEYWGLLYEERRRGILERYPKEEAEKIVRKGDGG